MMAGGAELEELSHELAREMPYSEVARSWSRLRGHEKPAWRTGSGRIGESRT